MLLKYDYLKKNLVLKQHLFEYYNIESLSHDKYSKLPFCIRIILESLVRNFDDLIIKENDINNVLNWHETHKLLNNIKIPFIPSRIALQDFSGIPSLLNFASIRDTCNLIDNKKTQYINPLCSTDLILDHAIADNAKKIAIQKPNSNETIFIETGYVECPYHNCKTECAELVERNRNLEFERSKERLAFLKWASKSFNNILLIPPFNGIAHQTNMECLARIVFNKNNVLYPETLVGTDTHTSMLNAFGVFSLNIGAIEAESIMLNQPFYLNLPKVIGYKLVGNLSNSVTQIDVILSITKHLKQINVNNKYIEFIGEGVKELTILERETIAYMCDEYGALVSYFPIDSTLFSYLAKSGRSKENLNFIEAYLKETKLYQNYDEKSEQIEYCEVYNFDLSSIVATCSGPKRSQDKINIDELCNQFKKSLIENVGFTGYGLNQNEVNKIVNFTFEGNEYQLSHGSVVVSSIANYTNACNPSVMLTAGLLAKKAFELGLKKKPYIKTSLSPGSGLMTKHYLTKSGMLKYLKEFGFEIVGYGCSICLNNSTELSNDVQNVIAKNNLITVSVLSGNRNVDNRINTITKANYLVSPALALVYAITGTINIDFKTDPIGYTTNKNEPIYLKDIWPTRKELQELELNVIIPEIYNKIEQNIWCGSKDWDSINISDSLLYNWNVNSTYIKPLPFLDNFTKEIVEKKEIKNANVLIFTTETITTDHISAAGSIPRNSTAAKFLIQKKVQPRDFNSFGSRRGNYEIMARATFSNIRSLNKLINYNNKDTVSKTVYIPLNKELDLYDAVEQYKYNDIPLIVIAGSNYGSGPSRDWAVKGQWLLGIKAIIAESFDNEHRINLIRMGILPLKFMNEENAIKFGLSGKENYKIEIDNNFDLANVFVNNDLKFKVQICINNEIEINYYKHGGQINYLTRTHFLKQ